MSNRWKRTGAVLLSLTMCMSLMPSPALAAEEEEGAEIISEEVEMAPAEEVTIGTPEEVPAETADEPVVVEEIPAETAEEFPAEEPEVVEEMPEEAAADEEEEEAEIDIDSEGIVVLSVEEVTEENIAYLDDDALDGEIPIDESNFPDDVFRTYVEEHFDTDASNTLSEEEIAAAKKIDMSDHSIRLAIPDPPLCRSLEGIQYFTELEYLDLYGNELSGFVNLSGFTNLKYLDCCANRNYDTRERITSLSLDGDAALEELYCYDNALTGMDLSGMTSLTEVNLENNSLTALDVSGCTNLMWLACSKNADLSSLDVSGLENLKQLNCYSCSLTSLNISDTPSLNILRCESNGLTSLDLLGCPNLTQLTCYSNELSELDVGVCPGLTYLDCRRNELTEIDVRSCTNLITLMCGHQEIESLDVSNNTALATLNCSYIGLTSLDLSNNPGLKTLDCSYNALAALDLSGNPNINIYALDISNQHPDAAAYKGSELYIDLTDLMVEELIRNVTPITEGAWIDGTKLVYQDESLEEVTYDYETAYGAMDVTVKITDVIYDTELAIDEVNFPDDAFRTYIAENFDPDGSMTLSEEEILEVKKIDISDHNTRLTPPDPPLCRSLEGIQHFTELEYLDCSGNELSGELDLSGFTKLTYLDCSSNISWATAKMITSLNLSGDTALEELYCRYNYITELDLSEFASSLRVLNCERNLLEELDVGGCTNLLTLYCGRNSFTTLDVSGLQELNWLDCIYVDEDPSELPSPRYKLEELILGGNDSLTVLHCGNNMLDDLDLSECTNLKTLNCEYNNLDGLDVSELTDLQSLMCSGNSPEDPDEGYVGWEYLDLSNNPKLYHLECTNLGLWELDLSNNPEIVNLSCGNNYLTEVDLSAQATMHYLDLGYQSRWVNAAESDDMLAVSLKNLVSPKNMDRVIPKDSDVTVQDGYLIIPDTSLRAVGYTYTTGYVNGDMDVYLFIDETTRKDISLCDMTISPSSFTYDGSELTPEVTVMSGGRALTEDTDYLIGFDNNIDAGIATVSIYGIGFYCGEQSKIFLISKADQTLTTDVGSAKVTLGNSIEITVGGAYGALTFESADPSVATVNSSGKVTGVSAGKSTILISAAGDANHNAAGKYITIEVVKKGQNVTAGAESSTIKVGSTTQIHADGIGKITYETSDPTIASVNSSGTVKGLSAGIVEITVTANGDSATGSSETTVKITVTEPEPDTSTKTSVLHIRAAAASKTKVALKWNIVENADGYVLYGAKCGGTMKELKTFTNGSIQTYKQTGLKKNTSYKFKIRAYKLVNGKKVYLKSSNTMHVTTTGGKYTNVKSVTASQTAVTLRAGGTQKIKTAVTLVDPDKKVKKHENRICFISNKPDVATVNSRGKITAVSKGSCTVCAYAADGIYIKIKVTVK